MVADAQYLQEWKKHRGRKKRCWKWDRPFTVAGKEEVEEDAGLIVSDDEQHFPHPKLRSRSYLPVKWTDKTLSCLQLSKEKMLRFFPLSNMW